MVAGMDFLVRTFLDIVQPNRFPSVLIGNVVRNAQDGNVPFDKAGVIEALKYELGFLVCLAIGLLYIVLMPMISICMARQETSRPGWSATLYWGAYIIIMAVILVGNVYLCISTADIKKHMGQSTKEISGTLKNLQTYTGGLQDNIKKGVKGSADLIIHKIKEAGRELGGQIMRILEDGLELGEIRNHSRSMSTFNISPELVAFNETLKSLTLPDDPEDVIKVKYFLECSGNLSGTLTMFQSKVEDIANKLKTQLENNGKYLEDIPGKIRNVTKDVNETDIGTQISNEVERTLDPIFASADETFGILLKQTTTITPEVEKAGLIIWAVGVALCCVLALVLVRNILGLLVGSVGVGPVISFLLCSLLMAVALPLFLLGGHSYTLVCKPWGNGELFRFIDTIDLGKVMGLDTESLGLNKNLSLTGVYDDCAKGKSLWDTLHLEDRLGGILKVPPGLDTSKFMSAFNTTEITMLSEDDIKKINSTEANFTEFTNCLKDVMGILSGEEGKLKTLNRTMHNISSKVKTFQDTVKDLLNNVDNVQNFLHVNASKDMTVCVEAYLGNFSKALLDQFTSQIGHLNCMIVAKEVDDARIFICENLVASVNTFWFSLSMCLYCLIPGIALSIHMAKYYRAEEYPPVSDDPGRSAASLEREQLKLMRRKAMGQFEHLYPKRPFVEIDDYDVPH